MSTPSHPSSDTAPADIALVISDVDGTLVTSDKRLTPAARAAVRSLGEAGIAFTIASSRPPIGLKPLAAELGLTLPMGAFNGSTLVAPDLTILSETLIPAEAARAAARLFAEAGLDIWVFAEGRWNLTDPHGPYTDLERRTLVTEVAASLRLPERTTERLIEEARMLVHLLPGTFAAMQTGEISRRHATVLVDHAQSLPAEALPAEALPAFETAALPYARTLTPTKFDRKARILRERT